MAHLVISEIFADMTGSDTEEFIEIYNPIGDTVDISGWSLQYLSGGASSISSVVKKNFLSGAVIKARSFYLVGTGDYEDKVPADMTWSQALNNTGATIFLVNDQTFITGADDPNIVDRLAYGTGSGLMLPEGGAAPLPPVDQSLERKAWKESGCLSAQGAGEFSGNGCDTDNNSQDFEINLKPTAQNTQNQPEPL